MNLKEKLVERIVFLWRKSKQSLSSTSSHSEAVYGKNLSESILKKGKEK
jgi:hypothetical protein